jgi:thiamine biosynthesis lipoprotein
VAELHRVEEVMGVPVGVEVRGDRVDAALVDRAFASLRWVDATFTPYRPDSEIRRLRAGTLALADAHPDVRWVLERCERLRRRTDGWFDVCARGALDPSAFVKGWAVERAVALLERGGARDVCVHAGGDVRVLGAGALGTPWRIGVQHPRERDRVAAVLAAGDLAVATSGAYERGEHIVDPHTGRPPEGVLSVTVLGPDLATADAYATAAFAMGRAGPAWTATLGRYDAITILADGRVLSTRGVARRRYEADATDAAVSAGCE